MKPLSLNIPKPCRQRWANLSPTSTGGFCTSCSKVVTDFTAMSDEQIMILLSTSQQTCGRFRSDQLRTYTPAQSMNIRPGFTLLRAGLIGLFILLISKPGSARMLYERSTSDVIYDLSECVEESSVENKATIITGIVRDTDDKTGIAGANVYIKGRTEGTVTDANGRFEFRAHVQPGDVLIFNFIGYETKEYILPKDIDKVLEVDVELYMDVTVLGELVVNEVYQGNSSGMKAIWNKMKAWF
jgi:hypothetical protein